MEQLSSCYFCGTALDEPLETYLLGTDDPGGRVTLCPTCHEKLETVFEATGVDSSGFLKDEASKAPSHAGTTGDEDGEAETGEGTGEEAGEVAADETESEATDDSPVRTIVGGETDENGDGDKSENETEVENEPADEEPTAGESDGEAAAEPTPESMDADDILVDLGDDDTLDSDGDGDDSAAGDDSTVERTGQAETDSDGMGGFEPLESADNENAEEDDSGGGRQGAGAADRTISKREFNKVMRLLQNREFPVDRMEILTVATGAYDLRQPEVDEAIDLAIDRGVIDEDEEQLVRPE